MNETRGYGGLLLRVPPFAQQDDRRTWKDRAITAERERDAAEGRVQDGHFVAMMLVRRLGGRVVFTEFDMAQAPKGTLLVTPAQGPDDLTGRSLVITVVDPS